MNVTEYAENKRDGDCPVRYVIPAATQPTFASKKENSKYTNHADCEQQYMDAFFPYQV